jgi:hypothetical protein
LYKSMLELYREFDKILSMGGNKLWIKKYMKNSLKLVKNW